MEFIKNQFSRVLLLPALASFIASGYLFLKQVYLWLKVGKWPEYPALRILTDYGNAPIKSWAAKPGSWVGAHKILSMAPLTIVLALIGVIFMAFAAWLTEEFED